MNLELVMAIAIDALPQLCKFDGDLGHHEWVNTYGFDSDGTLGGEGLHAKGLPHFICKHCHAVSKSRAITNGLGAIKRER